MGMVEERPGQRQHRSLPDTDSPFDDAIYGPLGWHDIFIVGRLAQLARAPRLHRGCRGFESLIAHYLIWQSNALSRILWQT